MGLGWFVYAFKPLAASTGTQTVIFCDVPSFTDINYFLGHSRPPNETKDWKHEQPLCLLNTATSLRFSVTLKPQNLSSPVFQSYATGSISCVSPTSNPPTERQEPQALKQYPAGATRIPGRELKAGFAFKWQEIIPANKDSAAGTDNDCHLINSELARNFQQKSNVTEPYH